MDSTLKSIDDVVEEITRIHKSLPAKPRIEDVEAAKYLIRNLRSVKQAKLEDIAKQEKSINVPDELFTVLQEMRRNLLHFQIKQQKREAVRLLHLENAHSVFDGLIQRASKYGSSASVSASNSHSGDGDTAATKFGENSDEAQGDEQPREATEKEIQKLGETGSEDILAFAEFDDRSINPLSLQPHMIILEESVNILENKIEEAKATLKMKGARLTELKADPECEEGDIYTETEFDILLGETFAAQLEYWEVFSGIQMLKRRFEKLEKSCRLNIGDTRPKLKKRVCACFFILILLVGLFFLQLSWPLVP